MYHADDEKSTSSRGDFYHGDYCDSDNDSSNERNAGGNSSGALSSSLSSIREDSNNCFIDIGEKNAKWGERRQSQVLGLEGKTKLQGEEQKRSKRNTTNLVLRHNTQIITNAAPTNRKVINNRSTPQTQPAEHQQK